MKTINFSVGEIVTVKGHKGQFRYVKNNVVRSIQTGRVHSVKYQQIKKRVNISGAVGTICILLSGLIVIILSLLKAFKGLQLP